MKLPERQDFLDYVEGAPSADPEVQKTILNLLASSAIYREQCAELKRDLYLVEIQVPEYRVNEAFAAELTKLANSWLKLCVTRRYSFRTFTQTREFMAVLISIGLLLVGVLGALALKGY